MRSYLQKIPRSLIRGFLTVLSVILIFVCLLQIGLIAGIALFNAGKGHDFIQSKINTALASSGYGLTFSRIFYDPVRGITLYDLALSDAGGTAVTLDRISVMPAWSQIPFRNLDVAIIAGKLDILHIPQSSSPEKEQTEGGLQPFAVPDIFFRSVHLRPLSVAALTMHGKDEASAAVYAPALNADVNLGQAITLKANLETNLRDRTAGNPIPESLTISGTFAPQTLVADITSLEILSPDYKISGKAKADLTETGVIDARIEASYPDLTALTQNNLQSGEATIILSGASAHPALQLDGILKPALLRDKGISDIVIGASAKDVTAAPEATITVKTSYKETPVALETDLAYSQPVLTFKAIKGDAPDASLSGAGALSTQTMLFDGNIALKASDLSTYADLIGQKIAGAADINVGLKAEDSAQTASVTAKLNNVAYDTIKLSSAQGEASFPDIKNIWPQTADVTLNGLSLNADTSVKTATLSLGKDAAKENTYRLAMKLDGRYKAPVSLTGNALLSDLTSPVPSARDIDIKTRLGKSLVALNGGVSKEGVDLKLDTKNFRLADLPVAMPDAAAGVGITGTVAMTGPLDKPVTEGALQANGISAGKFKGLSVKAQFTHRDNLFNATVDGKGAGIRTLNAEARVPVTLSLMPFSFVMDSASPLTGTLLADLDVGTIAALFLDPVQRFEGRLKADAKLAGSVNTPEINGTVNLASARFTDDVNGITIANLAAAADFTKSSLRIKSLTATDGEKGRMKGSGDVAFGPSGKTDLTLSLDNFHMPKSDLANGYVNAELSLANDASGYLAKGKIGIAEMNVVVPETFQSKIPELNIVERRKGAAVANTPVPLSLAIKIDAPGRVFVRGWGLDAEFEGAIDVTGNAAAPQLNGTLSSKRGRYEEFGKRFTLAKADLRFQGSVPPSPYLDVEATTPAGDVTASILLTGSVKAPTIAFSSTPALPQDEVLSRILFNRESSKISPFQAVQLAQTLQRFSGNGGGGLDPLGMLRSATGLDDISVDTDESGETSVGVGKYLTDKVYLEVEKGGADKPGQANIQIELTPDVNVQSEIGQDAQTGAGVFWKHDY